MNSLWSWSKVLVADDGVFWRMVVGMGEKRKFIWIRARKERLWVLADELVVSLPKLNGCMAIFASDLGTSTLERLEIDIRASWRGSDETLHCLFHPNEACDTLRHFWVWRHIFGCRAHNRPPLWTSVDSIKANIVYSIDCHSFFASGVPITSLCRPSRLVTLGLEVFDE